MVGGGTQVFEVLKRKRLSSVASLESQRSSSVGLETLANNHTKGVPQCTELF